jgi:hypothetical protein
MRPNEVDDKACTRAQPLPEEEAVQAPDEDHRAEAAAILRESEERVTDAVVAERPGDAAEEHRRSAETSS